MGNKQQLGWSILVFVIGIASFWRNLNIFTTLPAGGDAFEIVWGIMWYNHALTEFVNPFFYPYIFHPEGWPLGIFAHTPLLFLLAQPFYLIGGDVFAYNAIAILSFIVAYIGSIKYFRLFTKTHFTTLLVSAAYTFIAMRSIRSGGHLHILWATGLSPFFALYLHRWYLREEESIWHTDLLWAGVSWGLMISFSLYTIFLAPLMFLLLERKLFDWKKLIQIPIVGAIALLIGSSAVLPYYFSSRSIEVENPIVNALVFWAQSVNHIFIPSIFHPIPFIQDLVAPFVEGPTTENHMQNIGFITLIIVVVALWLKFTQKSKRYYGHLYLLIISLIFTVGPILKISDQPVVINSSILESINSGLWSMGHRLKPDVFFTSHIQDDFKNAIPLPAYLFTIFIPFWESARVTARFAYVTLFGAIGIAAAGLDKLPLPFKILLSVLWIIELVPASNTPLDLNFDNMHPAYQWISEQPIEAGKGIIEVDDNIMHSALPLYLSWQTKVPSASATGSFKLEHTRFLFDQVGEWVDTPPEHLAHVLTAYDVQFVMVHNVSDTSQEIWEHLIDNPSYFAEIGCFPPESYPVCIVEINNQLNQTNIFPTSGLTQSETSGDWVAEGVSSFNFIATSERDYQVEFSASPLCVGDQFQSMIWHLQDEVLFEYSGTDCETITADFVISQESIDLGWNTFQVDVEFVEGIDLDPAIQLNDLEVRPYASPNQ